MNPSRPHHVRRNRAVALAAFAFIAGVAATVAAPTPPEPTASLAIRKPNIVFIMADDMGFGDPGCYNPASQIPTPHMDKLAAGGLRFTDAHAPAAVCTPTRYGVITGRYCWRRKKRGVLGGYSPPLIENTRPTIASILKEQGYATACIGKWHIGATFQNSDGRPTTREKDIDFTAAVTNGPNALGFDDASGGWPPPRDGNPVPGNPGQLYELEADPGEQTNLWDKHQDVVGRLTTVLDGYQNEGRSVPPRK